MLLVRLACADALRIDQLIAGRYAEQRHASCSPRCSDVASHSVRPLSVTRSTMPSSVMHATAVDARSRRFAWASIRDRISPATSQRPVERALSAPSAAHAVSSGCGASASSMRTADAYNGLRGCNWRLRGCGWRGRGRRRCCRRRALRRRCSCGSGGRSRWLHRRCRSLASCVQHVRRACAFIEHDCCFAHVRQHRLDAHLRAIAIDHGLHRCAAVHGGRAAFDAIRGLVEFWV